MTFAQECLALARTHPERALVRLARRLDDLDAWVGFERGAAEAQIALARGAIDHGARPLDVHVTAALRAVDEHLADREAELALPPLPRLVVEEDVWVVRRPRGWSTRIAENQANQLEYWLRRHHVVPRLHRGVRIRLKAVPQRVEAGLGQDALTVWAGGFADGVVPDWSEGSPLGCTGLRDPETRWASVRAALEAAKAGGATLVVFPELTIDPGVRARVAAWLSAEGHPFVLVAAGSFHEARRNLGHLLGADGRPISVHQKFRAMRTRKDGEPVDEDVTTGSELELLYGARGLVGLAICLDFCEDGGSPIRELWPAVGPALMLVPSMGVDGTNHAHARRAEALLRRHGTTSIVASQHPESTGGAGLAWPGWAQPTRPSLCGEVRWGWCGA